MKGPSVHVDILPRTKFYIWGVGLGPVRLFLRGKTIDGAPHDPYVARMHGAQSACNRHSTKARLLTAHV